MSTEQMHVKLVTVLAKPGNKLVEELTSHKADLWYMATGISTEAGELLSSIKAHVIYGKPLDRENLVEELGDLEFYLQGLRLALEIPREETLQANIMKLRMRYGIKYSNDAAIARVDKE